MIRFSAKLRLMVSLGAGSTGRGAHYPRALIYATGPASVLKTMGEKRKAESMLSSGGCDGYS